MLLGQDRCGNEERDLATELDDLERRSHGELRLAVTHVPTNQAVHRPAPTQIFTNLGCNQKLILGLFVQK